MVTEMNLKMVPAALFSEKMQITVDSEQNKAVNILPLKPAEPVWLATVPQDPFTLKTRPSQTKGITKATAPHTALQGEPCCYICTVADLLYLFKVVALYRTLASVSSDFELFVCCTDEDTYRVLKALKLSRCTPVSLEELGDDELFALKRQRRASEFCWTLKSYFMTYLLEQRGLKQVLYCDGDMGFMGDPALLFSDWGGSAIYLCSQRDLDWVEQKFGRYQAGIVGVKNNDTGLRMLHWWKSKCREWCYSYVDNDRMGDQKYLDHVPGLFGDVKISTHRGIDAAPWNTVYNNNYNIAAQGRAVTIDGDPLIAYHFACIDIYDEQSFDLWHLDRIELQPVVRSAIYMPYLKLLHEAMIDVKAELGNIKPLFIGKRFAYAKTPFIYSDNNLKLGRWNGEYAFCTVSSRTYVARTLALYSSIRRFLSDFHLWICCADDTAYAILSRFGLENATLLQVKDVETPEIARTRPSKTETEYCWTLKPALCSYVLEHFNVNRLLYCDSDIYFFSHPRPIHELWHNHATLLNRQLGTPALENAHGLYQAGMIGFSKSAESLEILHWWQRKCTEWCYDDHSDPSRWGDQKYLQQIPDLFTSIRVNDQYGLVATPWNIVMNNVRGLQVSRSGSDIYLGNEKLTAYHFGSINVISEDVFDLWKHEPLSFDQHIIDDIYMPYLTHLNAIYQAIRDRGFSTASLFADTQTVMNPLRLRPSQETLHGNIMFG